MAQKNELRLSQLIQTFGPGALIDLPNDSVIMMGLDWWPIDRRGAMRAIKEPRLVRYLKALLEHPETGEPWIEDGTEIALFEPPLDDGDLTKKQAKVPSRVFPRWEVVSYPDRPKQQELVYRKSGAKAKEKKGVIRAPVRWVAACKNGHLEDIRWRDFVHRKRTDCQQDIILTDSGVGGDPKSMTLSCNCGKSRPMSELFLKNSLGTCISNRPWLGREFKDHPCDEDLVPMTRGAVNNYYAQVLRLIALPVEKGKLASKIEEYKDRFSSVDDKSKVMGPIEFGEIAIKHAFKGYSADQIWASLLDFRKGSISSESIDLENPKIEEFDILASGQSLIGTDELGSRLHATTLNNNWRQNSLINTEFITSLVKVHRLCEVSSLYGFSRIEPVPSPFEDGLEELSLRVKGQSLASKVSWLPAIEQFGEGIFIHLDPDVVREKLKSEVSQQNLTMLEEKYNDWKDKNPGFARDYPGHEYVFAHSLSHMLIEQIALEAGYPSTSLSERIYALYGEGSRKVTRFGVLIYAAGGGSLGTLGGLLEQADRLPELLFKGAERQEICSNDPICRSQSEILTHDQDVINGAACHGCLFTAETSCERRNILLDRVSLLDALR